MRALVILVVLGGCVGAGSNGSNSASRPAVMPMLSELPRDPAKRDAVLDSANTTAGPEQRKGMTGKERKAETAAATAAAILGSMFSHTPSVTLGSASVFDEGPITPIRAEPPPPRPSSTENADGTAKPDAPPTSDTVAPDADLIPWIKLK